MKRKSLERYTELFQTPGLRSALAASIVGRIPIGVATLAILLFLQARTGSFAVAGSTAALYVLGLATVAPFLGRMIDRVGPRPVLAVGAAIYPAMLLALVLLTHYSDRHEWVALAAFIAGASFPPITICMRTLYPRLLREAGLLQSAYSVDSALVEFIFIVGPALVALFVAAGLPVGAIVFAAVCAAVGNILFLRTPAVRDWEVHPASGRRSLLGPLRHPQLRALFAATVLYSLAFGLYEIAVTALAANRGQPAAAGVILALASVGSTVGALAYGAQEWEMPLQRQFLLAVGLMCAGLVVLAPISNLYLFAFATVIACAPMAPVIAVQSVLVSRLSPRDTLAESFTWGATCLLGGISGGIAGGGLLAEHLAPGWILLAAALSSFLSGSLVWRSLREPTAVTQP